MPMASMVACSPVRDLFETAATKSQSGAGAPLGASCNTTWSDAFAPDASVAVTSNVAEPTAPVAATVTDEVVALLNVSVVPETWVQA